MHPACSCRSATLVAATLLHGGNIAFHVGGDLNKTGTANFSILNNTNGHIGTGGNIVATIDGDVNGGDLNATIDNSAGGFIGTGGNITLSIGGNVAVGAITLLVDNPNGGQIGTGGNIFFTTGGDLTADSISAIINDREAGVIDSGGRITFNIGGDLTITDAIIGVSTRNDGAGGGTIGSDALVTLTANNVSAEGFFTTFISTNGGGNIMGDALNTVIVSGDLNAQGGILLDIADTAFGGNGVETGGHIGGDAIVTLSAQNIITASTASGIPGTDVMAIEASIYPNAGGTVGGDAIINVVAEQNISAPGSVLFWIANGNYQNLGGGTIGGDASVNIGATNLTSGDLFTQILNYGGASIGGLATVNVAVNAISAGAESGCTNRQYRWEHRRKRPD